MKRYRLEFDEGRAAFVEHPDGEHVFWTDHLLEIERLEQQRHDFAVLNNELIAQLHRTSDELTKTRIVLDNYRAKSPYIFKI